MTNNNAAYAVGTRIHYTGDMANASGNGTITRHRAPTQWSSFRFDILMDDGREMNAIEPVLFSAGPGRRFWLDSDWQAKREADIARMKAEYEQMMAQRAGVGR